MNEPLIIKMTPEGAAYAELRFKNTNRLRESKVLFKIDTGASVLTVSKKILVDQLGYSSDWVKSNIKEAPGKLMDANRVGVNKRFVIIPSIEVFGRTLRNWPFFIREEDNRDFSNLLGVSVLSHFKFLFNYETGLVTLRYVKNPKIKTTKYGNEYIEEIDDTDTPADDEMFE